MPQKNLRTLVFIAVLLAIVLVPEVVAAVDGSRASSVPLIDGITIFPSDYIWNVPVDDLPVDVRSPDYIARIGSTSSLHSDFGSGLYEGKQIGIPFNVVDNSVRKQAVTFDYDDESDPGPYPIPKNPRIEGGGGSDGDRHLLIVQQDEKVLYELYAAEQQPDGSWHAGSGAIFNLAGYELRPEGWTSADAAGLAILPGLVRYEDVANGEINHAIRFTTPRTQRAYVWPARHFASTITDPSYPPMGQRFRLKASFDTSGYPPQAKVVLEALKKYGMILSDNGAAWYITGAPDDRWDNDDLHTLRNVKGSDFEAVDVSSLIIDLDSGQVRVSSQGSAVSSRSQSIFGRRGNDNSTRDTNVGKETVPQDGTPSLLSFSGGAKILIAFFDRNENGWIEGDDILRFIFPT